MNHSSPARFLIDLAQSEKVGLFHFCRRGKQGGKHKPPLLGEARRCSRCPEDVVQLLRGMRSVLLILIPMVRRSTCSASSASAMQVRPLSVTPKSDSGIRPWSRAFMIAAFDIPTRRAISVMVHCMKLHLTAAFRKHISDSRFFCIAGQDGAEVLTNFSEAIPKIWRFESGSNQPIADV